MYDIKREVFHTYLKLLQFSVQTLKVSNVSYSK